MAVSAMALTACGGGEGGTAASWETPSAAAPATAASAGKQTGTTGKQAGTTAGSDKELCEAVHRADTVLTGQMVQAMQGGGEGPSTADIKQGLTEFAESLRTAAGDGDSPAAKATRKVAAGATEVAQSADPATAGADPAYEKSNTALEKACQAAGVKVKL